VSAPYRQYRKVLEMVGELHRRGYQRLRIAPGMSPSGMHWRCSVTPVSNVLRENGAMMKDWNELGAHYTTGQESNFFEWPDVAKASVSRLADLFIERFPQIAREGLGADWAYAGWYQEMLRLTATAALPIAYSDYFDDSVGGLPCVGGKGAAAIIVPMPPPGKAPTVLPSATDDAHGHSAPDGNGSLDRRLTLVRGHWYAWQMLPGYVGEFIPYSSPILVTSVKLEKSGKGWLELGFFNAFYAEGVQGFTLRMRVLARTPSYLIAHLDHSSGFERHAVIGKMTFDWLKQTCRPWYEEQPKERMESSLASSEVDYYLSMRFLQKLRPLEPG
jgi:hypothetical protein